MICAPIIAREDPLGVIHIDTQVSKHTYTEGQLRLVTAIGRMTGLAIEDAQLVAARPTFTITSWFRTQFRSDVERMAADMASHRAAGVSEH